MTYESALHALLHDSSPGILPGLERIETLLHHLGDPQNDYKVIHVCGTNGKGTVSALLARSLQAAGYTVGLFTSPYVDDYREQIQVNGHYIGKQDFADCFAALQGQGSAFEKLTAMMYLYFSRRRVDWAVVECGMGGKNDSTNVLAHPALCVFTSISLDHTAFLGNTVEEIAREKAGILKPGCCAVVYPEEPAQTVLQNICRRQGVACYSPPDQGDFRKNNFETARLALSLLGVSSIVPYPQLPGRLEKIGRFLLDGSHNPAAAKALARSLPAGQPITAVVAMMRDKDCEKYLQTVLPHCSRVIVTSCGEARSMPAEELHRIAERFCSDCVSVAAPQDALALAQQSAEDMILVCGSFYLCRALRKNILSL